MTDGTKVTASSLRSAAAVGTDLKQSVQTGIQELDAVQESVPGHTRGFAFATALSTVHTSWKNRLGDVRDECGAVARALRSSADNYEENEEQTKSSFTPSSTGRPAVASPFG
ncbi:WXG100 family type VII secretion target [Streptomyces sp. NPDC059506]|uniref:WXG100 family type VII secretion target n=1 Tax=Streptomyces TaxID=1883 RepID=UPI000CB1E9C0|nr:WXG100 family type VII secretion target [Streptomyces sp. SCUT-3]PLW73760.1 hypothetical protein C0036_05520 [Streptomyces sp. DJ]QMV23393.1 hypothetical protein GQS52_18285 [Streptomyces sp. SCUT-3]